METKVVPYETLIRYDENGKYKGACTTMRGLLLGDDGLVIASKELNTTDLGAATDPAFLEVLGTITADALVRCNELQAQLDSLADAPDKIADLTAQVTRLQGQLQSAQTAAVALEEADPPTEATDSLWSRLMGTLTNLGA